MQHRVFIVGAVWVEPKSSAAGSRMLQMIHFFLAQNWSVTFGTTSQKNPNSLALTELGVEEVTLTLNDASFDELLLKLAPTIVVFDRFMTEEQFGWRVAELCPEALRILDTEDLHCLRKTRQEAIKKKIEFSHDLLLNSDIAKREIAAIYRCDLSLIISSFEMELLRSVFHVPQSILYHLPFFLSRIDVQIQNTWLSFKDRKHFVSIGNFLHTPNVDATIQLKESIWKLIRKEIPEAELHIYGAYPTQRVLQLHNEKEGFFVHGFVENAANVIEKGRVLLAPLRFGAGIKGKLVDAMLQGTPTVTTTIGAEGMHGGLRWNGFIEDDMEKFAKKAVLLYKDNSIWSKAQEKGVHLINTLYNKEILERDFLDKIHYCYTHLLAIRNKNFTGKMLQHHLLQSTKYMSKWIEEKNKN